MGEYVPVYPALPHQRRVWGELLTDGVTLGS